MVIVLLVIAINKLSRKSYRYIIKNTMTQAIDALKALDILCMMLTGDNKPTAKWVSDQVGLDEYFAEVRPQDKGAKVKEVHSRSVSLAAADNKRTMYIKDRSRYAPQSSVEKLIKPGAVGRSRRNRGG